MYPRTGIGSLAIDNYAALTAVGIAIGIVCALRLAVKARLGLCRFPLLLLGVLIVGALGSHWVDVCVQWDYYRQHPDQIFAFWQSRAFIGAPIAGLAFVICYTRWMRMPTWAVLDCLAPGLTIGLAFGRLGCCAAGCCHGCPTDCWLGVRFHSSSVRPAAWRGLALHPTQLYEAAGVLAIFYGLLWLWRRRSFEGQVALAFSMAYPALRFVVEFFRGDAYRGYVVGWLSTSQFVSSMMFAGASITLIVRLRNTAMVQSPPLRSISPMISDRANQSRAA